MTSHLRTVSRRKSIEIMAIPPSAEVAPLSFNPYPNNTINYDNYLDFLIWWLMSLKKQL